MSEFYHEIRAFLDKHVEKCAKGHPKSLRQVARKCLTFSDGKVYSGKETQRITAMLLYEHRFMKDCVVFSQSKQDFPSNTRFLFDEDIRLPYENCVFEFEVQSQDLWSGMLQKILVHATQREDGAIPVKIFAKHVKDFENPDKRTDWTMMPYGVGATDEIMAQLCYECQTNGSLENIMFQFGGKRPTDNENHIIALGMLHFFVVLTLLAKERYTIQTAQPPKSLYSNKAPGHRKFYEHRVIVIDPDQGNPRQGDNSGLSGRKHPLHSVRGFWRKLKKPKADGTTKVWVKPHWRGDKELGVVTKEYRVLNTKSQP